MRLNSVISPIIEQVSSEARIQTYLFILQMIYFPSNRSVHLKL